MIPPVDAPIVDHYDGDYPSPDDERFPENADDVAVRMGVVDDVPWYAHLARDEGGPVLDLGCGTGRIAIPLARAGLEVSAVDTSPLMLARLGVKLAALPDEARARLHADEQDLAALDLPRRDHATALMAFSTLLCVPDFERQQAALRAAAAHLREGGLLALDVQNPLVLPLGGDPIPRPVCVRRHPETGRRYTRFATLGPIDPEQRQAIDGWYDDEVEGGGTERRTYRIVWRLIHRFELELMLRAAGFAVASLHGGPHGEPYSTRSPRLFVEARKGGAPRGTAPR